MGLEAVRDIIDAVEQGNFTITLLGLFANDARRAIASVDDEGEESVAQQTPLESESQRQSRYAEERLLSYQVTERLPPILNRNSVLTYRIRKAAARCIGPARILLNGRPKITPVEETVEQVIRDVATTNGTGNDTDSPSRSSPSRILDLPPEVLHLIVRHTSRDATAFSDAQFSRLRAEATDRAALTRLMRTMNSRIRGKVWEIRGEAVPEVREEWLRRGGWDKWECDVSRFSDHDTDGYVRSMEEKSGSGSGSTGVEAMAHRLRDELSFGAG